MPCYIIWLTFLIFSSYNSKLKINDFSKSTTQKKKLTELEVWD